jgi:hypothetical protein
MRECIEIFQDVVRIVTLQPREREQRLHLSHQARRSRTIGITLVP